MHSLLAALTAPGNKRVFLEEEYFEEAQIYDKKLADFDSLLPTAMEQQEQHDDTLQPIQPHENDVLMGRGGKNNQHSGNEKLREIARVHCERYRVSTKKGKSHISRQLVEYMRNLQPPARFLKRNPETAQWEDVGDDVAREKASQVLRDAVASLSETRKHKLRQEPQPEYMPSAAEAYVEGSETRYERTPGLYSVSSATFPPPTPITSSRAKRPRYSSNSSSTTLPRHFLEDYPPPFPHGPIQRQSFGTYNTRHSSGSSQQHGTLRRRSSAAATSQQSSLTGDSTNAQWFDLFHGELLESDTEEGGGLPPPEPHNRMP